MTTDRTVLTHAATTSLDLSECESEPIRHLGFIQPHGQLLAVNARGEITHASENVDRLFGQRAASILGRPLAAAIGAQGERIVDAVLPGLAPGPPVHFVWESGLEPQSLWIHRRESRYILEWERLPDGEAEAKIALAEELPRGLAEVRSAVHVQRQAQLAAELTARLTGFDRVMVYQFLPDWCGEVIAESRQSRLEPFLGLRYPASDIPPQARQLYSENLLRVLVDVPIGPVSLVSLASEPVPLDLTFSTLRAFSPYHIEYLKNMKVGATTTASILCDGVLWGLIACHHISRKPIGPSQRETISRIAQTLSETIPVSVARSRQASAQRVSARRATLQSTVGHSSSILGAILFGPERLRGLMRACGTAVWTSQGVLRMGDTASDLELEVYAGRLLKGGEDLVAVDSRADLVARFGLCPADASLAGTIALVVSRDPVLILFAFRHESVYEITWGGDVTRPVQRDEQTGVLSPRRSFAHYKQSIAGKSAEWTEEDLETARIVREVLREAANGPGEMTRLIEDGFHKVRALVTDDRPLQDSLLDAIGNGISLLYRSDSDDATVRYANQTLLDLAESCVEGAESLRHANGLLEAIGLPVNLLAGSESTPLQVVIPSTRDGLRHFLIERKLALEIAGPGGKVSLSALLFTDTTRSERAREALQAAQERAENLAMLKSSFLANMSHEIRTPMNGILGMVQLLQKTRKDAKQQHYLDVIQRSGDELLHLLNDVLDMSKIESGHMEVEKAPFDLTAVVNGVADLLRPAALESSLEFLVEFDFPEPRWFLGDSARLRQVLLNIAGNAVKFTESGSIAIRVQGPAGPQPNAPLAIAIEDTGRGIPEEHLPHIFEKFRQGDASTTRQHGGTGLGLAIARELVAMMGGHIALASTAGVGTRFTISLPLPRVANPQAGQSGSEKPALMGAARRILVAEDNAVNQMVIEGMLRAEGFDVQIAESGERLLELLQERPPDVILMDCHMPGIDGYETTARIRQFAGPVGRVPIVALTANTLPEERQRCLDAGMNDYLSKPIQGKELWAMLRKWACLPAGNDSRA
jgi:light-regulated signal transduction histidine kinase (bacteriophytochrome)/ActR/RegA family two-component response regulator